MEEKKHFNQFLIFLGAVFIWAFFFACSTTKKTPEQKAYEERQAEIELLKKARDMFPCDTQINVTVRQDTTFEYMTKDTVIYYGDQDSIVYINKYHTIEKVVDRIQTVIDRAEVQAARDSIDNINFLWQAAVKANDDSQKEVSQLKQGKDFWKKLAFVLGVFLLIENIFFIYKVIRR